MIFAQWKSVKYTDNFDTASLTFKNLNKPLYHEEK